MKGGRETETQQPIQSRQQSVGIDGSEPKIEQAPAGAFRRRVRDRRLFLFREQAETVKFRDELLQSGWRDRDTKHLLDFRSQRIE